MPPCFSPLPKYNVRTDFLGDLKRRGGPVASLQTCKSQMSDMQLTSFSDYQQETISLLSYNSDMPTNDGMAQFLTADSQTSQISLNLDRQTIPAPIMNFDVNETNLLKFCGE